MLPLLLPNFVDGYDSTVFQTGGCMRFFAKSLYVGVGGQVLGVEAADHDELVLPERGRDVMRRIVRGLYNEDKLFKRITPVVENDWKEIRRGIQAVQD